MEYENEEKRPRADIRLTIGPTWFLLYLSVLATLAFLVFIARI